MESAPQSFTPSIPADHPFGIVSNGGVERYLLEADSSTGFVAWRPIDGTILVSSAAQVSLKSSPSVTFWSCAAYKDSTPAGRIISFDCHGNSLTQIDVRALAGLEYLDCSYNQLDEIALDGLFELQALDVDNNHLAKLEVRQLRSLRVLYCASNKLEQLDLSGLDLLQILDCSQNPLKVLNREGCISLQDCR